MYVTHTKPPIPAGYQASGTITNATVFSLTVPDNARHAVLKAITAALRFRDDGTNPTSQIGRSLAANDEIELTSRKQLTAFRAIAQDGSGALEILYYKLT